MKESVYKSYDELPLFLNSELVAKVLGVSLSSGYELMSSLQSSLHSTRQICQVSIPLPCSSSNGKTPSIRPPSCWRPPACSTT